MAKNVKINGVTYDAVPSVSIPLAAGGGNAIFYETSPDTADTGDMLLGKTAHGPAGPLTGTMPNNGAVSGSISSKAESYTIPAGYHNGSGAVGISAAERAKIITDNIKNGVTLLGVSGKASVVDTTIASGAAAENQILSGFKAYVGGAMVTGTLTTPAVAQDSTSKILSIT